MSHSGTNLFAILRSKRLVSGFCAIRWSQEDSEETEPLIFKEHLTPHAQSFYPMSPPPQLEVKSPSTLDPDDASLTQRYALVAQDLLSSLPFPYRFLSPEDIELIDDRPVAAGGFADIWKATHGGRRVMLKSYRCYRESFDVARVVARFRNEIHVSSLLAHAGALLVGVYSTTTHPFGLIYEAMEGSDLGQYLRSEPNVERLKLLTEIARCINHMHDLGIVHRNLQTANVLVDKGGTARIGGLGNAFILPHSIAQTVEDRTTKANDVYEFGVMAREIFTAGRAAAHSKLRGSGLSRPTNHNEVTDLVWQIIKNCHNPAATSRMQIVEVVTLLEAELSRISASSA